MRGRVLPPTDQRVIEERHPFELQRTKRRALLRVAFPVLGVALVLASLLGIAVYSDQANRAGALSLSDDLIAALEKRIAIEVSAYLDPAAQALELARDLAGAAAAADRRTVAESFAIDALRRVPQLANVNIADGDGDFMLVRRGQAASGNEGGTDTKLIRNLPLPRVVIWTHRDASRHEIAREFDPADPYDPRTRPWYIGALTTEQIFWTGIYVFFSDRAPGITAALRAEASDGKQVVVGVDIKLDALSQFLAGLKIGRTGRAMIIDAQGELIAYPDATRMLRQQGDDLVSVHVDELDDPALRAAWDRYRVEGPGRRTLEVNGSRIVTAVVPLPMSGQGWLIMMTVPEDDFIGFVSGNSRTALAMSLTVVAMCALLAALLVRQGLRADRAARALLDRSLAITRQSNAFARLATEAGLFDRSGDAPPPALCEILAEVTSASRASIWRVMAGDGALRCEDSFEPETGGHVAGLELALAEAPQFLAALLHGEEIDVADAAVDRRTATLHELLMNKIGSTALLMVPVRCDDRVAGAIWLEDCEPGDGARNFARAVANMVAVRMAEAPPAALVRTGALAGAGAAEPQEVRSFDAGLALRGLDHPDLAAEVFPDVAVLVLRFADPAVLARRPPGGGPSLADRIICVVQEIGTEHALPYLKLAGDELVAAAGFGTADPTAAIRIADAALSIRDRCLAMLEEAELPSSFSIGLDIGVAIGSPLGREPRVFNLWGDVVRSSHAMAASAAPATIQVTEAAYRLLRQHFLFRPRGSFYIPRIGAARIFLLAGRP